MKLVWAIIGVGATVQYAYFVACMIAWVVGLHDWPVIGKDWQALAFTGATFYACERTMATFQNWMRGP